MHSRSMVRFTWGPFDKLVIFVRNEWASSMQMIGLVLPVVKWLNRPLLDASSITMLFSILGSICSTIGSMHPKWHAGVFPEPEGETTTTKRFPPSSYVEKTCTELFPISALVEVNALNRSISRVVPWLRASTFSQSFTAAGTISSNGRDTSANLASKS